MESRPCGFRARSVQDAAPPVLSQDHMLPEKKTASFKHDYVTTESFYLQNDYISLTLAKNVQTDDETVEQCETNETSNGRIKAMTASGTNMRRGRVKSLRMSLFVTH